MDRFLFSNSSWLKTIFYATIITIHLMPHPIWNRVVYAGIEKFYYFIQNLTLKWYLNEINPVEFINILSNLCIYGFTFVNQMEKNHRLYWFFFACVPMLISFHSLKTFKNVIFLLFFGHSFLWGYVKGVSNQIWWFVFVWFIDTQTVRAKHNRGQNIYLYWYK